MSEDTFEAATAGDVSMEVGFRANDTFAVLSFTGADGRSLTVRVPFAAAQQLATGLRGALDQFPDGTIPLMMSGTREE